MAALLVESLIHSKGKVQTALRVMELIFISAGLISVVFMVKNAVFSCSYGTVLFSVKSLTSSLKSRLSSPLCICLVINFMIVLIAATSVLHQHMERNSEAAEENGGDVLPAALSPPEDQQEHEKIHLQDAINAKADAGSAPAPPTEPEATSNKFPGSTTFSETRQSQRIWKDIEEDKHNKIVGDSFLAVFEVTNLANTREIERMDSLESAENFIEITQNTICRTENKNDDEDGISDEERTVLQLMEERQEYSGRDEKYEDSMEAMWNAINEGAEKRVINQLRKRETAPVQTRVVSVQSIDSQGLLPSAATAWKELRKSVTFDEAMSMTKRAGLARDPSMSLGAFNSRVEGFINRFNNALRIERQESEQRFLDLINRGI